ncbi:MAG TPA: alpha/beta fold hydrolase [Herpetosiphonaceae bacterium]|nr:alpha/beta fold hydrolase [Herpetosiphonaceae bacterium]
MHLILIHGQGRTSRSLRLLGWRLQRAGHAVQYFGYSTQRERFGDISARLVAGLDRLAGAPYAVVGHSLGGILTRAALPLVARPPEHLVMLGPPNNPPLLARMLKDNPLYQRLTADCGQKLADEEFYAALPRPAVPTTIFAGTAGPCGRWSPFGFEPNDGVVSVAETSLGPEYPTVLIPNIHTFIMNSGEVVPAVERILGPARP